MTNYLKSEDIKKFKENSDDLSGKMYPTLFEVN